MQHDFSEVFETDNALWERVIEIFNNNEQFPKKVVKGRELHHKFPRSFSKKLGQEVDNSPENLISLSHADHFRIHYYYYVLAKKGYRQPMALAFQMMSRSLVKQISPATMEECACDYDELRRESIEAKVQWRKDDPEKAAAVSKRIAEKNRSPEVRLKKSKAMKGKNKGEANGMFGVKYTEEQCAEISNRFKKWWAGMTDDEIARWKEAQANGWKNSSKNTAEYRKSISERQKGKNNPMFRFISWKEDGVWKKIKVPDEIPDEDVDDLRPIVHFIANCEGGTKNWRQSLERLRCFLQRCDEAKRIEVFDKDGNVIETVEK